MDTIRDSAPESLPTTTTLIDASTGGQAEIPTRARKSTLAARQASAFLRDHAAESVRIKDLSRLAGISERALRNAFHREHGLSPKQFDLRERLQAAHRALCEGGAPRTVTSIASQYGFFELGRFAKLYRQTFGESPSETMKHYSPHNGHER
jgi:AraC-like DNA-binding protein